MAMAMVGAIEKKKKKKRKRGLNFGSNVTILTFAS